MPRLSRCKAATAQDHAIGRSSRTGFFNPGLWPEVSFLSNNTCSLSVSREPLLLPARISCFPTSSHQRCGRCGRFQQPRRKGGKGKEYGPGLAMPCTSPHHIDVTHDSLRRVRSPELTCMPPLIKKSLDMHEESCTHPAFSYQYTEPICVRHGYVS